MPTMPAVAYSCPKCRVVLKSATAIPAGKTVRCTKCTTSFTPGGPGQITARTPAPIQALRKSAQGIPRTRPSAQNVVMGNAKRGRGVLVAGILAACLLLFTCVGSSVAVFILKDTLQD